MPGQDLPAKERIHILLQEYNTLRTELIHRGNNMYQLVAIAAGILGCLVVSRDKLDSASWWIVIALAIGTIGLLSWCMHRDIEKAAERIRQLESAINTLANEKLLVWENEWGGAVTGYFGRARPKGMKGRALKDSQPPGVKRVRTHWAAWCLVVFVLFNSCASHRDFRAVISNLHNGQFKSRAGRWLLAARAYGTDDGDIQRYFAYANAVLGRPYQPFFVRSWEQWQHAFQQPKPSYSLDPADPSESPPTRELHPLRPYRDFLVEYPPAFFAWTLPPAWLAHNGDEYRLAFSLFAGLLLTGALVVGRKLAVFLAPDRPLPLVQWAVAAVMVLGVVVVRRYDAAIALTLALTCWGLVLRRPMLAGAGFGVAIASKAVPIIVAPILLMYLWRMQRRRELWIMALTASGLSLALCLPALTAGSHVLDPLQFHILRPLQVESIWAGFLQLFEKSLLTVIDSFGSINLAGPFVVTAEIVAGLATCLALVLVCLRCWFRFGVSEGAQSDRALLDGVAALLGLFIALGKVTSPQYMTWLLPVGLLASLLRPGLARWLFLTALLATQLVFPIAYGLLLPPWTPSRWFAIAVLVRNGILISWSVLLLASPGVQPVSSGTCLPVGAREANGSTLLGTAS